MLPPNNPDRIRIVFDDHRRGQCRLLLSATLAQHLGTRRHLDLGGAPGRATTGDKMLTLVRLQTTPMRCAPVGQCSRLHGQGAIHPGAQLSLGACPSTRTADRQL